MNDGLPEPWQFRSIAYRVSPLPSTRSGRPPIGRWPALSLIIETVASDGLAGPARFGCYLICNRRRVLARGFFYGPAVTIGDKRRLEQLGRRLDLEPALTLKQLLKLVFKYVEKNRQTLAAFDLGTHLARLAADWTAVAPGERRNPPAKKGRPARPRRGPAPSFFAGGISLILWTTSRRPRRGYRKRLRNGEFEDGFRPRVLLKRLADGSVAIAFAQRGEKPEEPEPRPSNKDTPRRLLPLERLATALAGRRLQSLEAACRYFGVDYPNDPNDAVGAEAALDCLERAEAARRLYRVLLRRHDAQRLPLAADRVFSGAGYAKAAFEKIGINPPLDRYHGDLPGLGAAACAGYGGWSGVGVRSTPGSAPLPVRLLDAAGMYPTCAHHIGLWPLLIADQLQLTAVSPTTIGRWIRRQHPDTFTLSAALNVLCRIRPNQDVLPHRIRPGQSWLTTIASLSCEQSLWWSLADVLRSYFETGNLPKIDACLRLEGQGQIPNLHPIELPGLGRFDPNQPRADFFLFLADGRRRLHAGEGNLDPRERTRLGSQYKQWDNSGCSGIFFEVHPQEPTARERRGTVLGPDGPYDTRARSFEQPGKWFFPPFYSLVTGAARLLLYLGMQETARRGGTVLYWDTDSLAILATPDGGLIPFEGGRLKDSASRDCERALSYVEADELCHALERHSPYPPDSAGQPTLFRLQPEHAAAPDEQLHLHATASKRKTAYTIDGDANKHAVAPSEFALGHLQDPTGNESSDWIADAWTWAALDGTTPDWIDKPGLASHALTRHGDLARLNATIDAPVFRPWDQIVVAQADRLYGTAADGHLPQPIARNETGFKIETASWRDFATGKQLPLARTLIDPPTDAALRTQRSLYLRSFRSILTSHVRAPERKATGPEGLPCLGRTSGRLHSTPTVAFAVEPIGRESNYRDDIGVLSNPDYTTYSTTDDTTRQRVKTILNMVARTAEGRRHIAAGLELSDSGVHRYLKSGRGRPKTHSRTRALAISQAKELLRRTHPSAALPADSDALLYLATITAQAKACDGCGEPLTHQQRRWCSTCRHKPRLRKRAAEWLPANGQWA